MQNSVSRSDTAWRRNTEADSHFIRRITRIMTESADIGRIVGENEPVLPAFDENLAWRTLGNVGHDEVNEATDPPHIPELVFQFWALIKSRQTIQDVTHRRARIGKQDSLFPRGIVQSAREIRRDDAV